jgi:hypothetical protein
LLRVGVVPASERTRRSCCANLARISGMLRLAIAVVTSNCRRR